MDIAYEQCRSCVSLIVRIADVNNKPPNVTQTLDPPTTHIITHHTSGCIDCTTRAQPAEKTSPFGGNVAERGRKASDTTRTTENVKSSDDLGVSVNIPTTRGHRLAIGGAGPDTIVIRAMGRPLAICGILSIKFNHIIW